MSGEHVLESDGPADAWTAALPLGNGHLGAMCFGGTEVDRFSINDDTAWSGSPANQYEHGAVSAKNARATLEQARRAVRAGDHRAADAAVRRLQQRYSQAYMPFADLALTLRSNPGVDACFGPVSEYRRRLDLRRAVHSVSWRREGLSIERTTIVSRPHDILAIRTRVASSGVVDLTAELSSQVRVLETSIIGGALVLELQFPADVAPTHERVDMPISYADDPLAAVRGIIAARWVHDGVVVDAVDGFRACAVRDVVLYVATATTFTAIGSMPDRTLDEARRHVLGTLERAVKAGYQTVASDHQRDHQGLYGRVDLRFGGPRGDEMTTSARLARAFAHERHPLAAEPKLAATLFNFGRYLLITGSRPGTLPANLQGIWNDRLQPPWSSNYTLNINTQMNYWPAEAVDLAECHEPLFALTEALARPGSEMATRLYAAPGWAAHHNSDAWAFVSPVGMGRGNPAWAFWPMAGLWLVRHFGEHLAHGAPDTFAERAWPIVHGAVAFALAWADDLPDGSLAPLLSTSPEAEFALSGGGTAAVATASTMDVELMRDAFSIFLRLARQLGRDGDPLTRAAAVAMARLPRRPITGDGVIGEWADGLVAADPHHRHLSMLYGLYPGEREFDERERAAARASLDRRGDDSTGWSLAWKMCLRARLGQSDKVEDLLALVFRDAEQSHGSWAGGLYPNLFSAHPPFQIDGNLGYVAAVVECLVQSHDGRITLLPAVPPVLGTGSVTGLVARPGVKVAIRWRRGRLVSARITSRCPVSIVVRYRGVEVRIRATSQQPVVLGPADFPRRVK